MKAAAEAGTAHDTLRLAVLAALNIADEMFRCRETAGERARAVVDRTRAIEQMLDAALHS
jgi:cell division protein ZapA (FtsZ GTPase activity inhibitor)